MSDIDAPSHNEETGEQDSARLSSLFQGGQDWLLAFVASLAAEHEFSYEVTVFFGGFIITGRTINMQTFLKRVAEQYRAAAAKNHGEAAAEQEPLSRILTCVVDATERRRSEHPEEKAKIGYLHLEDARVYDAAGRPAGGSLLSLWRGRLSEISSFTFGIYSPPS